MLRYEKRGASMCLVLKIGKLKYDITNVIGSRLLRIGRQVMDAI